MEQLAPVAEEDNARVVDSDGCTDDVRRRCGEARRDGCPRGGLVEQLDRLHGGRGRRAVVREDVVLPERRRDARLCGDVGRSKNCSAWWECIRWWGVSLLVAMNASRCAMSVGVSVDAEKSVWSSSGMTT